MSEKPQSPEPKEPKSFPIGLESVFLFLVVFTGYLYVSKGPPGEPGTNALPGRPLGGRYGWIYRRHGSEVSEERPISYPEIARQEHA